MMMMRMVCVCSCVEWQASDSCVNNSASLLIFNFMFLSYNLSDRINGSMCEGLSE